MEISPLLELCSFRGLSGRCRFKRMILYQLNCYCYIRAKATQYLPTQKEIRFANVLILATDFYMLKIMNTCQQQINIEYAAKAFEDSENKKHQKTLEINRI